jgi:hypothetical protein
MQNVDGLYLYLRDYWLVSRVDEVLYRSGLYEHSDVITATGNAHRLAGQRSVGLLCAAAASRNIHSYLISVSVH